MVFQPFACMCGNRLAAKVIAYTYMIITIIGIFMHINALTSLVKLRKFEETKEIVSSFGLENDVAHQMEKEAEHLARNTVKRSLVILCGWLIVHVLLAVGIAMNKGALVMQWIVISAAELAFAAYTGICYARSKGWDVGQTVTKSISSGVVPAYFVHIYFLISVIAFYFELCESRKTRRSNEIFV